MTPKLTTRQRVFVEEYLSCWIGSEAAARAGYSKHTASEQAARLLSDVRVKRQIERRISELTATTNEILTRLTDHSRGDIGDCLNTYGAPDIDLMRKNGKTHLVKKLKSRTTTISKSEGEDLEIHEVEIELYDAQAATVQLAKLLRMYPDASVHLITWQDKVIDLLLNGTVTPQDVIADLGEDIATELFERARLPGSTGSEAREEIAAPASSD